MATNHRSEKPTARQYSPQEKAAAVRMVRTLRAELGTEHGTVQRVASQLGFSSGMIHVVMPGSVMPRNDRFRQRRRWWCSRIR